MQAEEISHNGLLGKGINVGTDEGNTRPLQRLRQGRQIAASLARKCQSFRYGSWSALGSARRYAGQWPRLLAARRQSFENNAGSAESHRPCRRVPRR